MNVLATIGGGLLAIVGAGGLIGYGAVNVWPFTRYTRENGATII